MVSLQHGDAHLLQSLLQEHSATTQPLQHTLPPSVKSDELGIWEQIVCFLICNKNWKIHTTFMRSWVSLCSQVAEIIQELVVLSCTRFRLDINIYIFSERMTGRKVVESLPMEVLKKHGGAALRAMFSGHNGDGLWLDLMILEVFPNLNDSMNARSRDRLTVGRGDLGGLSPS